MILPTPHTPHPTPHTPHTPHPTSPLPHFPTSPLPHTPHPTPHTPKKQPAAVNRELFLVKIG
ncbi:MAG: hypothetical protein LW716_13480 [Microcystis sp. 53602_E8]|nr:hypothetical protein [Microcystis sp. 53602_E8]